MSNANLLSNVEDRIANRGMKSLDVSLNELYDMYKHQELLTCSEYSKWDDVVQSRFIESLILEMPVFPILVTEIDRGVYEMLEGQQRLFSYFRFREPSVSCLRLRGCDILPELNGLVFNELPVGLQIKLKRTFIRMDIVNKEFGKILKSYNAYCIR